MILTKEEAICLVLGLSSNNEVSSTTKLNKLLARLNLFFIPVDIQFKLNRNGSYNAELSSLKSNEYFDVSTYTYKGTTPQKYILKTQGKQLFKSVIEEKIPKILTKEDFEDLKNTIFELSKLNANLIAENEHSILLVDVDDQFKLEQKLNEVLVEMTDLFREKDLIKEDSITNITLKALIEYSYYLVKYLKEKKFKNVREGIYDFEANMFDYYFLHNVFKMISFIKKQISAKTKDTVRINKFYQYLINAVRDYPFSIYNKDLKEIMAK
ncbi:hypothetical protein COT07_02035 [Candidatus Woesearchaeota archaeon CG07_land_8_20_14_0_80_44_23]|nr:MAG: hypothetical protein COT07_02035 [Candidatus Woesearchaeota archaeon CG07_land_8_20_14_0_80_44_23]